MYRLFSNINEHENYFFIQIVRNSEENASSLKSIELLQNRCVVTFLTSPVLCRTKSTTNTQAIIDLPAPMLMSFPIVWFLNDLTHFHRKGHLLSDLFCQARFLNILLLVRPPFLCQGAVCVMPSRLFTLAASSAAFLVVQRASALALSGWRTDEETW